MVMSVFAKVPGGRSRVATAFTCLHSPPFMLVLNLHMTDRYLMGRPFILLFPFAFVPPIFLFIFLKLSLA